MGENEIKDPRKMGVSGLKGLNTKSADGIDYVSMFQNFRPDWRDNTARKLDLIQRGPVENVGVEGFGESRYDKRMTQLGELADLNESRANIQPWYDQIGAGILKGSVLAATTFADGVLGTIAGALNILGNTDKISESDSPMREIGNLFISNPFSVLMQDINEKVESALPNYYTKAEQEDPWWEHIFSANFIGDKFLKNLGFTVGAAYSGKLTAGAVSKAMGLKGVRDAFKGAVTTASGRTLNTASEIAKAYKSGDAFMDGIKLTEDLGKAAKQLRNAEWTLKTVGAVNAAMGEGRIEAIGNSKEWETYHRQLLDDQYQKDISNIENALFEEHPEWFSFVQTGSPETGIRYERRLVSPEGQAEWANIKNQIDTRYNDSIAKLAEYRAAMANADFGLNTVMLSASNIWQFGRFLSGGYNTGKLANGIIKGSAKDGFSISKGNIAKKWARALSNPLAEMNEEMMQSWFSEGTGLQQSSKLNSFYGAKVNPEAEEETSTFLNSMVKGFSNIYGDADNWEEGFIGGLTGLLGIPKLSRVKGENGKKKVKLSLEGELWEGISDVREEKKQAQSLVDALNQRVQSPEFLNYYQGFIRHQKYQNDMEAALANGSNFDYKNAEHSQFISDAIMFEKAGRLQDLYDIIEEAGNVTQNDVDDIRNLAVDKNTGKSIFEGKSDQEVIDHVNKQVRDAKTKLQKYSEISTNLKTLYGEDMADDYLEEMTWMMTQIDDWESRFKSLFEEVKKGASQVIGDRDKRFFGANANQKIGELTDITAESLLNTLNRKAVRDALSDEKVLADKDKDKSLRNMKLFMDLSDMLKIYEARNEFIDKYTALSKNPELFSQQVQDSIKAVKEDNVKRILDEAKLKADSATSVNDLREIFSNYPEQKKDIIESLKNGGNDTLKKLAETYEDLDESSAIFTDILSATEPSPEVISAKNIIQDALENAESLDDILTTLDQAQDSSIPEEVKATLQEIVDKFIEQKKSGKTSRKDTKKSKNKPKKAGKKGFFDMLSDSPDVKDALSEEEAEGEKEGKEKPSKEEPESLEGRLEEKSQDELVDIAKKGDASLPNEDNTALRRLAAKIHDNRLLPAAGEESNVEVEDNASPEDSGITQGLRSWVETEYEFNPLKNRRERKAVLRNNPIVNALQELGAFQYVDEGYLADRVDADENLPIHLIISSDSRLNSHILLAVEIGEKDKSLNPIEGSDGKRYQVVGVLGFNKNNKESIKNYNDIVDAVNDEYTGLKKGTSHIVIPSYFSSVKKQLEDKKSSWDYYVNDVIRIYNGVKYSTGKSYQSTLEPAIRFAIDSGVINKKYEKYLHKDEKEHIEYEDALEIIEEFKKLGINRPAELIDFVEKNANKNSSEGSAFISSYSTKVTHIYSGRMVKSTEDSPVENKDLTKEFLRGRPLRIGIYYNSTRFETPGLDNVEIVPLNTNNQNPRAGSIWLMTKEADGRWYPKHLRAKRFTETEYPLDVWGDSPIVERIGRDAEVLVNPESTQYQKSLAKYDLKEVLHFPEGIDIAFSKKGNIISIPGVIENITEGATSLDEATALLIQALQSDELGLRFNVVTSELTDPQYQEDILKSGILTTDLYQPGNVNASFDIAPVDSEGKPSVKGGEIALKGHTGKRGIQNVLNRTTLTLNSKSYSIDSEGNIYDDKGEAVSNQNSIDELTLLSKINQGLINPVSGSKRLYLGVYTNDGTEFGIVNGVVKTGNSLKELKSKAEKLHKKELQNRKVGETALAMEAAEGANLSYLESQYGVSDKVPKQEIAKEEPADSEDGISMETISDELAMAILGGEEASKPVKKAPEIKVSKPTFTLTESFTPISDETKLQISSYIRRNRGVLRELRFKNVEEFMDFIRNPENNLPSPETITSAEAFNSLIDTIKNCR